jgi:nucleoside-diphosphate-sugar epimerase
LLQAVLVIIITGEQSYIRLGFIGKKVVEALLSQRSDLQIYLLCRKIPKTSNPNIRYIQGTFNTVKFSSIGDLLTPDPSWISTVEQMNYIIHCAQPSVVFGWLHLIYNARFKQQYTEGRYQMDKNLLSAAERSKNLKKIVFLSGTKSKKRK